MRFLFLFILAALLAGCGNGAPASAEAPANEPAVRTDTTASAVGTAPAPADTVLTILYLGDSLTAGYGLRGGPDEAYPALIEERLETQGVPVRTVNAGVSGDTSAGGLNRIGWYLSRHQVDVLVLALGANDGLRGIPPPTLRQNLEATIDRARAANPDVYVVLAGMMIPPSMGLSYFESFSQVFQDVADEKDAVLIPFLLEGVGGVPDLNQPDGIHPTAEGQRIMADTVWETLQPVVEEAHAARLRRAS